MSSNAHTSDNALARYAGIGLAAVGLSHFVKPQLFDSITMLPFPDNTRQHVYIDGAAETAIGLGLVNRKTRTVTLVAGIGYLAYLGVNVIRNRQ